MYTIGDGVGCRFYHAGTFPLFTPSCARVNFRLAVSVRCTYGFSTIPGKAVP